VSGPSARVAQALLVALAAAGGLAALAFATGTIGFVERDAPRAAMPEAVAASPSPEASAPAAPAQGPAAAVQRAFEIARYTVCGREEAPARLSELGELWAVSCGSSVHVIAIEAEQGVVIARRVARLSLPSTAPDRAPRPAPIARLAEDAAWLVSTLRVDRNGSPVGGAIFRVPLEGGDLLGAATRLHDALPGALAAATFDRAAGRDFAVLQLGDARVAQAGELWLFGGGAAPSRIARKAIEPDAHALAPIDLDGDGIDEVAVLARAEGGRVTVLAAGNATPLSVAAPGADGLYALDHDGDGKRELIASGPRAFVIARDASASDPALAATRLPALDGLRDLIELDTDADGRTELTGYAHPSVIAARTGADRRVLFELSGEGFAVLQARPAHLDGDGRIDLIALVAGEEGDLQVELVLARTLGTPGGQDTRVTLPNSARELRNAPLLRELELR
jgi:hypothetical protein